MDCSMYTLVPLCECISKASGHCGMSAINTAAVSTPVAVVLLRIHRFATDLTRCAMVGALQCNARRLREEDGLTDWSVVEVLLDVGDNPHLGGVGFRRREGWFTCCESVVCSRTS